MGVYWNSDPARLTSRLLLVALRMDGSRSLSTSAATAEDVAEHPLPTSALKAEQETSSPSRESSPQGPYGVAAQADKEKALVTPVQGQTPMEEEETGESEEVCHKETTTVDRGVEPKGHCCLTCEGKVHVGKVAMEVDQGKTLQNGGSFGVEGHMVEAGVDGGEKGVSSTDYTVLCNGLDSQDHLEKDATCEGERRGRLRVDFAAGERKGDISEAAVSNGAIAADSGLVEECPSESPMEEDITTHPVNGLVCTVWLTHVLPSSSVCFSLAGPGQAAVIAHGMPVQRWAELLLRPWLTRKGD